MKNQMLQQQKVAITVKNELKKGNKFTREFRHLGRNWELLTLSIPGVLFILVMSYFPMVGAIVAFKQFLYNKGIFGSPWVGLDNFKFFFKSSDAWVVTRNTVLYNLVFIILGTLVSLFLAILLSEISRYKKLTTFYQTVMFLPFFISWMVVSFIVYGFFNDEHGLVNHVLQTFHQKPISWYESPGKWPVILILANLWKGVGFSTLVYFAGIMGIDPGYYEAAKLDGANRFQMATKITIPSLVPMITILLIMAFGGIFRGDFGLFYFVPNNSSFLYPTTDVIDTYVFRALRSLGDIGMSSAVGLYQSIVGLILVLLANYITRKINNENSLW